MKKFLISIFFLSITLQSIAQVISIAAARSQSIGNTVTIKGVATNGSEMGTIRYFQDSTGGIAAYSSQLSGVQKGDIVQVTGVLKDYNGLLEIDPVTSYNIISTGNPLPAPKLVSLPGGFSESNEGQLVQVNAVHFTSSGNFSSSSSNYTVTDGSNNGEVRVWASTNIAGTPIPGGNVHVIGLLGEYFGTYQLQPRSLDDFLESGPKFLTPLIQSNISQFSFDVSFETKYPGTTVLHYGKTPSFGNIISDSNLDTSHFVQITGLDHGSIYYLKAYSIDTNGDTSRSGTQLMATASLSPGEIKVYFNQPVDHAVNSGMPAVYCNQSFDDSLIAFIDGAQSTLDIAIYNLDNQHNVIDAINAAYQRGVLVRVITDEGVSASNYNAINVGNGNKKKSPTGNAPSGGYYGIMHNKFLVKDAYDANPNNPWVWTGSTNFTTGQLMTDPNNVIAIQDQALAKAYTIEFDEMWSGKFGPEKTDNTPHQFKIGGRQVSLYFSPSDNTEQEIKNTIRSADTDLYFALFAWTRYNIAYEIEDRIDSGVFVAGIVNDTSGSNSLPFNVLIDDIPNTLFIYNQPGLLHHKYMLVDPTDVNADPIVLTGSHNWSSSANTRNDENTLIVHDATVANQYYQEWVKRYKNEGGSLFVGLPPRNAVGQKSDFVIYPNPASGKIHVRMNDFTSSAYSLTIYDLGGHLVHAQENSIANLIDISGLANGMYLLKINTDQQQTITPLIIHR